jgi:hydrogenase maturation protein HypF
VRVRVDGTVQGVGFRPFVHRLASELGLAGSVGNDERGVLIETEGSGTAVARFLERLAAEAPPLARIEAVAVADVAPTGERGFAIAASRRAGGPDAPVTPDAATCPDCLRELLDPADRRFRYPFVNCTNCGPRFTIVRGVPYDRPLTTMAGFAMCPACRAEYEDPRDRRFHAQPNACPVCGPRAVLVGAEDAPDALAAAAARLRDGAILAVKGIGGYHLACRADDESAVAALRARKHREDKPFALLAADLGAARALVDLRPEDEALLAGRERPIVLARRRPGAAVAPSVAPRSADLGVLLPYSPLHHLLARDAGAALVLTSGNVSDEPIAFDDADARARLARIADGFLVHDRPIETRTDDSVVRSVGAGPPLVLRRSRGYVPQALGLPLEAARPVLGVGAELKATVCLARGRRAWVSHHIGDLENAETLASFTAGIAHLQRLFAVTPEVVACDLHPDYLSTSHARGLAGLDLVAVQHHHAHLAATLAEHGRLDRAVGAIYDGTGLGTDGTVWGGELLVGGLAACERAGHLWPVRLPGGDRAAREPWRMACAWLVAALGSADPPPLAGVEPATWDAVARMARTGTAAPVTTSVGRLFDAVAALAGLRTVATYEGQAAGELEAAVDLAERGTYPLEVTADGVLDARPTILAVRDDAASGLPPGTIAARFHRAVAAATAEACAALAAAHGLGTVVLAGGVFQNRVLLDLCTSALAARGLEVLRPERLPPNDGAISFGQVAVAAATLA